MANIGPDGTSAMVTTALTWAVLILAFGPAVLYWINVLLYRRAPPFDGAREPVSILIPTRNEERSIAATLEAALASRGVEFEVLVLDDDSSDRTGAIVFDFAARDPRVRLMRSAPLPDGWCGKQFACYQLGRAADHERLLFLDADVRLAPDGVARLMAFQDCSDADLVSGVPRQETGTILERLLIPLVHFLLLGYLPMFAMRLIRARCFGAGCGQLFLARRNAYTHAGGHEAIRASRHDGITLPRAFRKAGFTTDLCDATDLATCRMYRSSAEVWFGLAKNATEGLASPLAIVPWTLILLGGQVAPWALLLLQPLPAIAAILASYSMRLDAAVRFRQSLVGAVGHPIGVVLLVAIQWYAAICAMIGKPIGWKGRGPR